MQKLLKRSVQAEKQVARRNAKRKKYADRAELRDQFRRRMQAFSVVNKMRVDARQKQRQDWIMGPLAPQRDTPVVNEFGTYFGAVPEMLEMGTMGKKQINLACKWAGGKDFLCLKVGDRVAIMEGPDKGQIAPINSIEEDKGHVVLGGELMQRNITVNEALRKASPNLGFLHLNPIRVPIQAIRLVHPLVDPVTKKTRDVIIKELVPTGIHRDKPTGRISWSRVVPGLNIEIPWPRAFEEAEQRELEAQHPEYPSDTLRINVEEATFVPTLLHPPMPAVVIDELRNRYSKFRTRHEDAYIQKKIAEERKEKVQSGKKSVVSMMTPLQELNLKIRQERKARGQPDLTDSMLLEIGRIMAKEDGRRFGGRHMRKANREIMAAEEAKTDSLKGASP